MKVLLTNGSPHAKGCTFTALSEVEKALKSQGIETEIIQVGHKAISGCIACGNCYKTKRCAIDDEVNVFIDKAKEVDGFVFGSPVHFASATGAITSFMDRVFYVGMREVFKFKPAAAIVTCRRGGSTATLDQLYKYFSISGMPIVSSQYWNMVHGNTPEEVQKDKEGMQIMRTLGNNMAWLIKCINEGKKAGLKNPETEKRVWTNFIR